MGGGGFPLYVLVRYIIITISNSSQGLLPTRLFSSAAPVATSDSATGANTTDGEDEQQLGGHRGNQCAGGLMDGMKLARGRVIAELTAKIWRVYRRRMQQRDR